MASLSVIVICLAFAGRCIFSWRKGVAREVKYAHQRFESKVKKVGKCWVWTGCSKDGIGYFTTGSRRDGTRSKQSVLRFAFRFFVGPIEQGQVVYRRCETLACVNPDHLVCGTRRDLVSQSIKHGRWIQGDASRFPSTRGEKNGRSKISDAQRKEILTSKVKAIILARRHGVSETQIYNIQKTWEKL